MKSQKVQWTEVEIEELVTCYMQQQESMSFSWPQISLKLKRSVNMCRTMIQKLKQEGRNLSSSKFTESWTDEELTLLKQLFTDDVKNQRYGMR